MGVVRVFIIFFLLTTPTFAQDPPRISLDTFRGLRIGHAPLTMIIKIKVPRHETNRLVCITWASSEAMAGESCYEYDGTTNSAISPRVSMPRVPPSTPQRRMPRASVW
jgi:hypothetical protein